MIHAYTQQLGAREAPLGTREAPLRSREAPLGSMEVPQRSREAPLGSMEVPQRSREVPLGSMEVPLGSREMSLDSMGGMALSLASESLDMDSSQSLPNQRLVVDFLIFLYRWSSIYNTTPLLILFLHPLSYFFSWSLHMCRSQLQHGAVCPLDFLPFNCFNTFECRAANLRVHKNHSFHTYNTTYVSLLTNCKSV